MSILFNPQKVKEFVNIIDNHLLKLIETEVKVAKNELNKAGLKAVDIAEKRKDIGWEGEKHELKKSFKIIIKP